MMPRRTHGRLLTQGLCVLALLLASGGFESRAACDTAPRSSIPTCDYFFSSWDWPDPYTYSYLLTPGCEGSTCGGAGTTVTDRLSGSFWLLGEGDVARHFGVDNGNVPVHEWLYGYPGYPTSIFGVWNLQHTDNCYGVRFGNRDCMAVLVDDQPPDRPGGVFALLSSHVLPGTGPVSREYFDLYQDGPTIDLRDLPAPEFVFATETGVRVRLPATFDDTSPGFYLDPACEDEAPPLEGYRVFNRSLPNGAPPPASAAVVDWQAGSNVVASGGATEVTLACDPGTANYVAAAPVFDSGFTTSHVSAPVRVPCFASPSFHAPLLDADFDDKPLDQPIELRGAEFGEPAACTTGSLRVRDAPLDTPALELASSGACFRFVDGSEVLSGKVTVSATVWIDRSVSLAVRMRTDRREPLMDHHLSFFTDGSIRKGFLRIGSFEPEQALPLSIVVDLDRNTYDVYVDGCQRLLDDEPFWPAEDDPFNQVFFHRGFAELSFGVGAPQGRAAFVDDVRVQRGENPYGIDDTCDGIDNDCDGAVDEGVREVCQNGIDDDCDGQIDGDDAGDCAAPPVELQSFTARPTPRGVLLAWRTSAETDTTAFHVWRGHLGGGRSRITTVPIPARGGTASGASYRLADTPPLRPGIVEYFLEPVSELNAFAFLGPATVRIGPANNEFAAASN